MRIERVGDFTLGWGESLVWDDRRQRLFFVDCAAHTLHWLEDDSDELHTLALPSMAAGIVPTENGTLVACLDDGLHQIDPDNGTTSLLAAYPDGLGRRANDACADLSGNLITGTLNLQKAEGSSWYYSSRHGWRLLDPDISNTNGPAVAMLGGSMTLIIGDTSAQYYSYPYDARRGTVGPRTVFGDVSGLGGLPDGATLDHDGGLWCALVGGAQLARFTTAGLDRTVGMPVANPTDVTFGGRRLDRLYVVSVAGGDPNLPGLDGALLVIDDLGVRGRLEPRFRLS
ncbi:MAG TPA: SMP-30/gluconolactonase/LRE family protein [Acidimicrobiales bacterium]|jgi:sugar lactone lactonase YvrE|nr:SMP-30/gluconolactonase/LRE family protein [Acidimicrobiales bacterium]